MKQDVARELIPKLLHDYGFKEQQGWLRAGKCPSCGKKELYTNAEHPWVLHCGRLNNCGAQFGVKELYPELFENWSDRFKPSTEYPNASADAYLQSARGFSLKSIEGIYTQETFADRQKGITTATVRFVISEAGPTVFWERLIDQPGRFGSQKANFRGSYQGFWWKHPKHDLLSATEIWLTEGIFDAIALLQVGKMAVSAMSCNNFPEGSLNALKMQCNQRGQPLPTLVVAYDGDKAGREFTLKHIKKATDLGFKCKAAVPGKQSRIKLDWNDLFLRQKMEDSHFAEYFYLGDLLTADTAEDKAIVIYNRHGWRTFHFDFAFKTYWFEIENSRYEKALEELDKLNDITEEEKRNRALRNSQSVQEIATCAFNALYFQQNKLTDESWYYMRIDMRGNEGVKNTFTGAQISGAAQFKQRLVSVAPGAIFTGTGSQLDRILRHQLPGIQVVDTVEFIGYSKEHGCYVFNEQAVAKGKVVGINDEDFFELGKLSIKSLNQSVKLELNADKKDFSADFVNDIWSCFGAKGMVAMAFWLGSLFAEQIRQMHKSYPFLEVVGEPGAGKSTLIEFLWKLLGRNDYEGFDPSKSTAAARSRNFSQVSNLPVVLIEGDRGGEDTIKQKGFDWDELKTTYNGRGIRSTGVKNGGNDTREPPFRGAIVISQNADVQASEAVLQRIVHMTFTAKGHSHSSKLAAERLERMSTESVSGFLLAACSKENEILISFIDWYKKHEETLQANQEIKLPRIVKNHAQMMALVSCLPLVLPNFTEVMMGESWDELIKMAENRQQAISADHPTLQTFWEMYDYINGSEDHPVLNHSETAGEIAINLNHVAQVAAEKKQQMPDIKELKRLLKTGRDKKFVSAKSVRSAINDRINRERDARNGLSDKLPAVMHCWVFKEAK